jgi:hypothetical protein
LILPAGAARAADVVACTVRAMHGLEKAGRIDKRLTFLKKQLSKPPFSAFKTIDLLQTYKLAAAQGKVVRTKLPTKKILKLTFKEKLLGPKTSVRLRMHLSITPPRAIGYLPGTQFTIADGGTLLVAGDAYKGGTLVVGITCKSK